MQATMLTVVLLVGGIHGSQSTSRHLHRDSRGYPVETAADVVASVGKHWDLQPQTCYAPRFGCYPGNNRCMHRYPAYHGYHYRKPYNFRQMFEYPWHANPHEPTSLFAYNVGAAQDAPPKVFSSPPQELKKSIRRHVQKSPKVAVEKPHTNHAPRRMPTEARRGPVNQPPKRITQLPFAVEYTPEQKGFLDENDPEIARLVRESLGIEEPRRTVEEPVSMPKEEPQPKDKAATDDQAKSMLTFPENAPAPKRLENEPTLRTASTTSAKDQPGSQKQVSPAMGISPTLPVGSMSFKPITKDGDSNRWRARSSARR